MIREVLVCDVCAKPVKLEDPKAVVDYYITIQPTKYEEEKDKGLDICDKCLRKYVKLALAAPSNTYTGNIRDDLLNRLSVFISKRPA
jgi:hypothetical protein